MYCTILNGCGLMIKYIYILRSNSQIRPRGLPLAGLPDSFRNVWRWALDEEVEHYCGSSGETVPVGVRFGRGGVFRGGGRARTK